MRECDEVEKAKYVAYIDEGNDTYDVSLSLSKKESLKVLPAIVKAATVMFAAMPLR